MPEKSQPPAELLALVHAHLKDAELTKAAKKLKSEYEDELPKASGDGLMELYNKHGDVDGVKEKKKRKALLALIHELLKEGGLKAAAKKLKSEVDDELVDAEGSLMEMYTKHAKGKKKGKKSKKEESESESEGESEEEEEEKKSKKSKKSKKADSDEEDDEEEQPKKKKSKKENSKESSEEEDGEGEEKPKLKPGQNPANRNNVPFQRIKAEEQSYLKVHGGKSEAERLKDNTFESKGGDHFGAKASEILSAVRGRDFTHAKNKKKRSFRSSGPVDMGSNSIKFVDSDDDE